MEKEKKEQLTARDPKKAWEVIQELIFADENMTIEELDEQLREYGVEPDDSMRRLFELALSLSRESGASGQVSPHVSDILSQLAAKYYRSESRAAGAGGSQRHSSSREECEEPVTGKAKARAAVLSFHRSYKGESPKDQAIRKNNEKRLQEKAKSLRRKKDPAR